MVIRTLPCNCLIAQQGWFGARLCHLLFLAMHASMFSLV